MKNPLLVAGTCFSSYTRCGALLLATVGTAKAQTLTFAPPVLYSTGARNPIGVPCKTYSVALADMNGDGKVDIVAANYGSNTVGVLLGQTGGTFAAVVEYSAGPASVPRSLKLGDLNGDGRPDIVVANSGSSTAGVLSGQTGGTFAPVVTHSMGINSYPVEVALSDIDGDGQLDIITANTGTSSLGAGTLLRQVGGAFAAATTYPIGGPGVPMGVAAGDVNADGIPDIVTANYTTHTISVLVRQVGSTVASVAQYPAGPGTYPTAVALGDVNGDGRLDIVTANSGTSTAGVMLGQAGGTFAPCQNYSTGTNSRPNGVALGDVNNDGQLDIVTANFGTSKVGILLGQEGTFNPVEEFDTGANSAPYNVDLADLNADGRLDVAVASFNTSTANVLLNTGTFTPLATTRPTAAEVALFPNPAHNAFAVQLPAGFQAARAELLNALGQVVRRPTVAGPRFQVETAGLAPGVYTLRLLAGAAVVTKRVAVQ